MATTSKTDDTTTLPADLDERVSALAAVRIAGLATSAKIDAAKLRTLKLEHARLAARYGADSPQVAAVATSFDARVAASQTIGLDAQRASVVPVPVDTSALTVTGRVVDQTGKSVAGATVSATDTAGKPVATTRSDAAGRYRMKVPAKPATAGEGERTVSVHAARRGGKPREHARRLPCEGGVVEMIELLVED